MTYDVAFRHQQALDPSALTNVRTTLHAIGKAIEDCRNAGVDPDTDPAVVLLARHMGKVSTNRASETVLRAACLRRIEALRRFPTLLALALRGVEYDAAAKDRFHKDGRKAMRRLAEALRLAEDSFEVRSWMGDVSVSGYVILAADSFSLFLRIGAPHEGRELLYRAVRDGTEQAPNRYAPIRELLQPERFAERLRRDLGLASATAATERLLLSA